ncbi:UNVERIFIED_CONTAM: hypothetical protein Sradi_1800100 [Sesamum radiatum]|uniref:Uncharacterized protein n=1 Tax=Sesamum radiatum TaxID=300843 RepID=A0AAW2TVP4_SESRA
MVPVPFIILYLKRFATFLTGKNETASRFLDMLFKRAKEKAGPVEEFQWLGLMLFVAVPFPGTELGQGHHCLYIGHAVLACCLRKFCWCRISWTSGKLAGRIMDSGPCREWCSSTAGLPAHVV